MRTNTFDEIDRLFDRMNRFAGIDDGESWGDHALAWHEPAGTHADSTRVDLTEHDDELVAVADLPGFEREEIDLSVEDDRLVIAASHSETDENAEESYLQRERRANSVRRTISLPVAVDPEGAEASYVNGVLTVTLPKLGEGEGYRIDIE